MTTRRFFIKQLLFTAWMLISCGMRKTAIGNGNPGAGEPPRAITLTPVKGPVVQVECLFPKESGKARGAHPLQGALLCGIEAYRQVPRCAILFGKGGASDIKKERCQGGYRYRFKVDLDQTLGLKGAAGVYYIHLACRQLRSAVIAYVPGQQQTSSSL
jgi:hypothetical protein